MRQLESMIRLSEAMSRMSCSDQVLPKHVKEAYRLLNKSIIRVDQPDIHFDEEEDEEEATATENENEAVPMDATPASSVAPPSSAMVHGTPSSQQPGGSGAQKKQLKLSYEEYKTMANLIVHYLRRKDSEDVRKSDVISWYLKEIITRGDFSQEEIVEKKLIVEKVLDRLAYMDNVLVPIGKQGLAASKSGAAAAAASEEESLSDPILIVHPNYVEDD